MHPILFRIGNVNIYSYGFMVSLGFLAGILLAYYLARKVKIDPDKILDAALFLFVGAIFGARLFYVIFFWHELNSPWQAFMVWNGGLVFYGGVLFGILGLILACKILKISVLDMLDIVAPATMLGYAFGRIGCFLNGCCYGEECAFVFPWAVKFPHLTGLRYPTQIYASIAGLLIFAVLFFLLSRRKFPGQIFAVGLSLYATYRFFIEFFRTNAKVFLNLTLAQWASLFLVVLGLIFYFIYKKRR
ncbi:prolipoprotein diacylglyceryl transferase [candidate division WOR-1 bacterium RIFOXYA2_FULL_37_7]|uniref:Phosphatidylglycerol--prolipoprotein diacylglyceryl transferase n=1 Tax=candidate division WOR-1 bacterium RIFOXYB2_FULL_37_13 TaxID=1802579 RepID=A0A1F4SF33_UNCSA|nr:MAG: prolipoprotein diacylglyceryl transferase [candidate division WOR-1 bacterium RIFOXYA2_FULL_37_7]OGC19024.1 MAG: prolipoprotein diacylglyceryl transferase [candidate division WOR-1 bacterium RIFOXYB2_FULL_37_13]